MQELLGNRNRTAEGDGLDVPTTDVFSGQIEGTTPSGMNMHTDFPQSTMGATSHHVSNVHVARPQNGRRSPMKSNVMINEVSPMKELTESVLLQKSLDKYDEMGSPRVRPKFIEIDVNDADQLKQVAADMAARKRGDFNQS